MYYIGSKQRSLHWDVIDFAEQPVCGEHATNNLVKMRLVNQLGLGNDFRVGRIIF